MQIKMKMPSLIAAALALLLLLSSCASTYTAVLQGGGGGADLPGIPGLPGVGGSQGGGGGGSQEKEPLASDHLFHEPPLETDYSGIALDKSGFVVDFSSGLSQAMGKGKYFFARIDDEEGALAAREEIAGENPYLAVSGAFGYTLYALKEYQDLKRVAISFEETSGERVLGLYEYRPIEKEELESLFWSDEMGDSLLDSLIKAGAAAAEGTQGYEGYEYKKNGYRSAFFIANYDMEQEQPEDNRTPCFALALPIFERELTALALNEDALFYLYYRPLYSGVAYTEERAAVAARYPMGDGSTVFAIPVQNDERVLTAKKDTLYRDYEFLVVCVNKRTGKKLFYKRIETQWNLSSEAFFKYAKDHGYLY